MAAPNPAGQRAQALIETGMILTSELSLDAVLQRIVELAVEISDARYGALGVLTPDRRAIEEFITVGVTPQERTAIGDPPVGHGILGVLIEEAGPLRIRDIGADPRSVGFPPNHPPMRSFLGAPVVARGNVFGNIYLTEKRNASEFSEEDEAALIVLASQAGIAIENARLYEETRRQQRELQRLSVLEDRERIAKELHDGVIQALFAVGMALQGAAASTGDPTLARRLEDATDDIDRTIRDLRNYIFGLRPGVLADRQLDQAIHELGADFERGSGVVTVVDVDPHAAAALATRADDVIQMVRASLANVGRHAQATTCRVSVRTDPGGTIGVVIDDDGVGFDASASTDGMGLANLRARAEALRGTVTIDAALGDGSTVTVTLPA